MENIGKYLIRNARVVKPTRLLNGDVAIEDGTITYIGTPLEETSDYRVINGRGHYAVPGFIDIHSHGGRLFDLTGGLYDPQTETFDDSDDAFCRGLNQLLTSLAAHGTTGIILATVAAPMKKLTHALSSAASFVENGASESVNTCLHGILVEGTFIKHGDFAGAQNPDHFLPPSVETFERLNAAARGHVAYVNLVPEHGDAAYPLMKHLTDNNILIGAGHTDADADQYFDAVERGLKVAIHFTNGPTGSTFKPFGGGGVLQAVLGSHKVYAELIADGYHVSPAYILDIIRRKGTDRIIAISDSMFVTGDENVAQFRLAGIRGRRAADGHYLEVVGKRHTLFGSVLTMPVAFGNFVSWMTTPMRGIWNDAHEPLPLEDAILAATRFCSVNPATALGIFDPPSRRLGQDISMYTGGIQVGKRADIALIRLDGEPGRYRVRVDQVFVGGRPVK